MDFFMYGAIYLVIINVTTFIFFGFDKWMARTQGWRTKEATLWLLSFLGGTIGGIIGMQVFRHKTQKTSFQFIFAIILVVQAFVTAGAYYLYSVQ